MYEPIKKLGQNFLSDPLLAGRMVDALDIQEGDVLIEVGAGHGFLTEELSNRIEGISVQVYAVEVDRRFSEKLATMFYDRSNVLIINQDILRWLPNFVSEKRIKLLGSLPYYITSPIIHTTMEMRKHPFKFVYLMQKEVAQKISAQAPDASYLSSFAQSFYVVEYLEDISKEKFEPIPKVDGGIVSFTRKEKDYTNEFIQKYEGFLHKAFSTPRKMLNKVFTKQELRLINIDPKLRPQNIQPEQWLDAFIKLNPEFHEV
ncbi:ribosomal RNA small subunit methyltransferase A [Patescibacteria group bacterium]|nr:ribosomal RNA small subunit methyltransferase A [Patescibacteria group bacterium]